MKDSIILGKGRNVKSKCIILLLCRYNIKILIYYMLCNG